MNIKIVESKSDIFTLRNFLLILVIVLFSLTQLMDLPDSVQFFSMIAYMLLLGLSLTGILERSHSLKWNDEAIEVLKLNGGRILNLKFNNITKASAFNNILTLRFKKITWTGKSVFMKKHFNLSEYNHNDKLELYKFIATNINQLEGDLVKIQ